MPQPASAIDAPTTEEERVLSWLSQLEAKIRSSRCRGQIRRLERIDQGGLKELTNASCRLLMRICTTPVL